MTIYLFIKEDCIACNIQKQLLSKAIENEKNIELKIIDSNEHQALDVFIDGYPFTAFVLNNEIVYSFSGTKKVETIKKIINDINF